jgi:rfaE bifunctional protein nucleotidyltransferase chain/domain
LVVTNGCFDILHPGHLFLLEEARTRGKILLVGINSDETLRVLKGPGRPAIPEKDRVAHLCALEAVNAVCVFPELDAQKFIFKSLPDLYVKGGDYTMETINQDERMLLKSLGTKIEILPKFQSHSTSDLLKKFAESPKLT